MRQHFLRNVTLLAMLGLLFGLPSWAQPPAYELETIRDIAYYTGPDADPVRHKLDIHRPKGCKNYPVLFFVHGGSWTYGNKDHFGVYTSLARTLAKHGIGTVCPNYRLSPQVKHPEHIRDVARAFAWTCRNIAKYDGDAEEMFVAGHSAGGHLIALLATDESFLKDQGLSLGCIKGAIPISGVLNLPPSPEFDSAFGTDPAVRRQASPITHVNVRCPPFLILHADADLPPCGRAGARLSAGLKDKHCPAQVCEIASRNHLSILLNSVKDSDPVMQNLLSFMMSQIVVDRLLSGDFERLPTGQVRSAIPSESIIRPTPPSRAPAIAPQTAKYSPAETSRHGWPLTKLSNMP